MLVSLWESDFYVSVSLWKPFLHVTVSFNLCKQPACANLEVEVNTIMQTPVEQLFRRFYIIICAEVVMTEL